MNVSVSSTNAAKPFFVLRINTIYSGNLAWFSVNSSTHSFSSWSCDSIKFFQLGWGTRENVRGRPNLLCALSSLDHSKAPYFNHFPG